MLRRLRHLVGLIAAGAGIAKAQAPARIPPAGMIVTERIRDRWIHGGQRPESTPFAQGEETIRIDSATASSAGRRLVVSQPRGVRGVFTIDSAGMLADFTAAFLPLRPRRPSESLPSWKQFARSRLFLSVLTPRLALPAVSLGDIVAPFHPDRAAVGGRWTDTLAFADSVDGARQSLTAIRTSTIVGDSSVGGRTAWIVRDSSVVSYAERWTTDELAPVAISVERSAAGVEIGSY